MRLPLALLALALAAPAAAQDVPEGAVEDAVENDAAEVALEEETGVPEGKDPSPYPAREVLAAFATACSTIEDMAVAKASVKAAGWEEFTPAPESQLGKLLAIGKGAAQGPDGFETIDGANYRKSVAGRDLELALSGAVVGEARSKGCRIYDFTANRSLTDDEISAWTPREPNISRDLIPGFNVRKWNPGLKPGHMEMEISFVAQGTRLPMNLPISGLILQAKHVE